MCTNFARWDLFTTFASTVLVQAVLQIRVFAIYARSRLILSIMALFYAISIGLAGWIVIIDMSMAKSSVVTLVPGGQLQGCSFPNLSSKSPILWISPLIFETILYILVLYKGWQMFRTTRHLPTHQGSSSGGLLLGILVRDSVIYFFILSLIYFSTVIAWGVKDLNGYIDIMGAFTTTMTGVLGSKMILNLRHAGTAGSSSTELTGPFSQDVIEFARKEEC
ncbi:hypothetical protein D9613_008226 [Agrocybe pediades]|uniref:Uncharacterized protein n=1 Tax=Agrocybe pediades TaxID=84607 RepID=A0A8H4QSJ3_9AGAR|nr:hypothetical protein D9613_008226 [Agrocybe pediades]